MATVYDYIASAKAARRKQLAVLLDPDKLTDDRLQATVNMCEKSGAVGFYLVGGSHLTAGITAHCVRQVKQLTQRPVILFPGSPAQYTEAADAMLYLSLISGRNPDLLIGRHVEIAYRLKKGPVEALPTGYILIDGGKPSTVTYISNTAPIPRDKPDIALSTALAGELLGLKLIYLEGGSGAEQPVPVETVGLVASELQVPLIVGGGIRTPDQVYERFAAGADVIVIGTAFEREPKLIDSFREAVRRSQQAPDRYGNEG